MPKDQLSRGAAPAAPRPSRGMGARSRPTREASGRSAWGAPGQLLQAAVVFAVATVALTYPLALGPRSLSRLDNGDARLNAWAISWVSHQIVRNPLELFEANTFHPLPHSLAYSEHLTLQGILAAPLLAIWDDLVLANNLLLLFSIWASAFAMYLLARQLTGSHLAALLSGLFFSFAPFRFNRLPHIQTQLYAFLPLTLLCLHRFVETRRRSLAWLMAAAFVLQALAGTYLGAIAAVALAVALATLLPFARPSRPELSQVALSLGAAALVLTPFVLPYLWVHRELGVEWGLEGVGSMAATPASYLASSSHLYRGLSASLLRDAAVTDYLFPGITLLVLGGTGAVLLARSPGRRPLLLCYGGILGAGVILSLGPATPVHSFLYEHVVFFRGLRALTRFGLLPLLALATLAAVSLAWLFEVRRFRRPGLVAAGIALFFVVESTALPYGLEPFRDDPPEVYTWLARQPPGAIVELPFKVLDTRYMFWARHHGFRPMLNGDSGFIPASHVWMKHVLGRFPSRDSIELLRRLDVRYVILHLGAFRRPALLRLLQDVEKNRGTLLPARDFGRDVVFEVVPGGEQDEAGMEELLPIGAGGDPAPLFDGDRDTSVRAESPAPLEVRIELDEPVAVTMLRLHYGPSPRTPAERVELAVDGPEELSWSTPDDWPAVTELVSGLLQNPRDGTQQIRLPPVRAKTLRLRLHGVDGRPAELSEITLYGPPAAPVTDPS